MRRLLVTGFGPFPSMPRNPSAALARSVAASPRWRILDIEAQALVLTTAYATLPREFDPALATKPDAVLMIGVAGRSRQIRVEWRATSRRSTLFPDVAAERAEKPHMTKHRPVVRTPLPARKTLLTLRRHHLPARLSRDAGRYLCNAAYFRALGTGLPILFIHIPRNPDPTRPRRGAATRRTATWPDRLGRALVEVGIGMLRAARPARVEARSRLR